LYVEEKNLVLELAREVLRSLSKMKQPLMVIREGGKVSMIYDAATAKLALSTPSPSSSSASFSPAAPSDDVGEFAIVSKAVQQLLEDLIGNKVNGLQAARADVRKRCQLSGDDKKTLAHIRDLQAAAVFSRHFTRLGRLAWMAEVESMTARLKPSPCNVATKSSDGSQAIRKKKPSSKQRRALARRAKGMKLDLDLHDEWADGGPKVAGAAACSYGPLARECVPAGSTAAAAATPVKIAASTRTLVRGESDEARQPIPKMAKAGPFAAVDNGYKSCMTAAETATSFSQAHPAGTRVVLSSLLSRPELHGVQATVLDFDLTAGRYRVELRDGSEKLRVKACNVKASIF
jgi:hypothetical protein